MFALAASLLACGEAEQPTISTGSARDASMPMAGGSAEDVLCDMVERDGDSLIVHEEDVTATFRVGEDYDKTVMLFGGETLDFENAVSNIYLIGLDKVYALMLAEKYEDFYLCSSPGGMEAQQYIIAYDLVPASCAVHDQIVRALRLFATNNAAGGDRVSLRFEGALLEIESVVFDNSGQDVTEQVADRNFHLVTGVTQLTGESVLAFGTQ